jgi:hypothetical protein
MDESKTSAPDKDRPHPFQAGPEVPGVPRLGPAAQETAATDGTAGHLPGASKCTLCGAPRDDRIHIEGEAQADADSPKWG